MVVEVLAMTLSFASLCAAAVLAGAAVRRSTTAEKQAAQQRAGNPAPRPPHPQPRLSPPAPPAPPLPPGASGLPSPPAYQATPYGPPPPGRGYGAPPRPRSARGLWVGAGATGVFGFVVLVTVVGALLISLSGGDRMLVTPLKAGGLERHDDPELRASLERQKEYLREAGVPRPTVAFYREPGTSAGSVAFAGGWGRIPDPGGNLRGLLRSMGGSFGAGSRPRAFPPGPLEGEVLCMSGATTGDDSLPICGWADRSTIGVVMARDRTLTECAEILLRMRLDMETERN